ncbi:MAG: SsrA-binding protein SmpB [Oligoflexia bacterium]|nr:SsrA-binding protein SmpB [Oligoflexia bacterium]
MAEKKGEGGIKLIATNPIAHSNYFISEVVEAGIALTGTEVKSLRTQSPNLRDAFVEVRPSKAGAKSGFEAWLMNTHIGPYSHGNVWNHEATRRRKLLLHTHQIERLFGAIQREGMTAVPIQMYFKSGRAKVEIGLGKGKKKHDKRQDLKKRAAEREMDQAKKCR